MLRASNIVTQHVWPLGRLGGTPQRARRLRRGAPSLERLGDLQGGGRRVFMLPNSNHEPALGLKKSIRLTIALPVLDDLLRPIIGVGGGPPVVLWTAVPETPIKENRDLRLGEHQVRSPAHGRQRA